MNIVYIDTDLDACERSDHERYGLTLNAVRLAEPWNGFVVPVVTASEFRRFVSRWAWNDPNGTWNPDGIREGDGALIYDDGENEPDVWTVVGMDDGTALYALSGWMWSE